MGYMTGGDRKRDLYSSYSPYFSPESQTAKRPRVSSMHYVPGRAPGTSNSTVDKLSRYPERTTKLVREIHAPCRNLKYGLGALRGSGGTAKFGGGGENQRVEMLSSAFNYARRVAIGTLRFIGVEKGLGRVDEEAEKPVDVLEKHDSSIEEVHVVDDNDDDDEENGKEVRSMVLDEVVNEQENDVKVVEVWSEATPDGNMEVEKAREMVGSLGLDRSGLSVEVYKKLLDSAQRRDPNVLQPQIEYYEKKRASLQALRSMRKPLEKHVEETPREPFIPLTKEEETEVKHALLRNSRRKLLVKHDNSGIDITGEILQCLSPGAWLNDEVINVYLELLKEREKREPKKFLKCHFCNTFFYKKVHYIQLAGGGYKAVKRWTTERKLGYFLFDCEKARYYIEEVKDKSKVDIDISEWEFEFPEDLPEQLNGYDCGMFMIKYADFYSRGLDLCFSQENMQYFRQRTAKEILRLKAD
ncbi:Ubiquitin-like-specific protease ESD4 [Linum perenne]